jgi:hypothetical protein
MAQESVNTELLRDLLLTTKDGDWGKEVPQEGCVPYRVIRGADFPEVREGNISTIPVCYLNAETVKRRTLKPNDIIRYQNRSLEAAEVIAELIQMAKDLRAANQRGEQVGLSEEELAFYDALEVNDSAVKVLGDETLKQIARELIESVRRNATLDWTLKESARAKLRAIVKRLLRKYGYPPENKRRPRLP